MKHITFFIAFLCLLAQFSFAQEEEPKKKTRVNIEHYDKATYSKDLGDMQRLIGHVRIRHDSARFFCDSAYFYEKTNSFDALHFVYKRAKLRFICQCLLFLHHQTDGACTHLPLT